MCGICGITSQTPINDLSTLEQMQSILRHRGPDGAGEFHDGHVALAMRRLSIIDLTGGWQPLYNEDRSLVLIANGEIYNFVELRQQLQTHGHRFSTGSDCETILHLYEDYGTDCVHHLRGMFAFALWDKKCLCLLLARDRMGEKPLYIYEGDDQLIFASELKALLSSGSVSFELDPLTVNLYFHYQYFPEPMTPIKGVRKLAAAHIMKVSVDPWQIDETCYWRMEDAPPLDNDPAELIRSELETVSELVIRSDVPVGVALSGGLDSSAIAALAARQYPGTMHAFSIGYPGRPPTDERTDAKALADELGMPFHDVELDTDSMVTFFPELVYWRDDPIADISGYCYYAVMKLAREYEVPVMLQGQGGDELFWGYSWLRRSVEESLEKLDLQRSGLLGLFNYLDFRLPETLSQKDLRLWAKSLAGLRDGWERFRRHRKGPPESIVFYDLAQSFQFANRCMPEVFTPSFIESLDDVSAYGLFKFKKPWPRLDLLVTRLICETYLMENGIAQGDRLSMASSVELRLPLVDHHLLETIIGLRKNRTDYHMSPKAWFKAALEDILPDEVINRPKRGFEPPTSAWYPALFATYGSMLEDGYLVQAGIIKPESARNLAKGPLPLGGGAPLSFKALVLEIWCRRFHALPQILHGNDGW